MSEKKTEKSPENRAGSAAKSDDKATREERLAAALRDNLKRRKQQARQRKS